MKVLVLASAYPHPGHPFSGIFNERSVQVLSKLCDGVEVLAPRPYVPPLASLLVPRWKAYAAAAENEIRDGVAIYRPSIPVIPRIAGAFWMDQGAFVWLRQMARKMHHRANFDAILSFDLVGAGGIAWRIGRDLGIPAIGWATGGDVRVPRSSSYAAVVIRALRSLDLVFYQSHELLEKAADLLGTSVGHLPPGRHVMLPRGIAEPPVLPKAEVRKRLRGDLRIADDKILVLSIGRVTREKGIFELLDATSLAANQDPRITCVLVGSVPAFDDSTTVKRYLDKASDLRNKVRILPTCKPMKVWEYLCTADIFAFASHHEGMPNSLLEAMAMGLPAIAFGIPPVLEIEAGTGALIAIPPFDCKLFAQAILRLSASADARARIGERGKARTFDRFMVRKNMATAIERLAQVIGTFEDRPRERWAYN